MKKILIFISMLIAVILPSAQVSAQVSVILVGIHSHIFGQVIHDNDQVVGINHEKQEYGEIDTEPLRTNTIDSPIKYSVSQYKPVTLSQTGYKDRPGWQQSFNE